jgi:hypothetical protein
MIHRNMRRKQRLKVCHKKKVFLSQAKPSQNKLELSEGKHRKRI